ncbi:hypothetical protein RHMOL_Rhmol01G0331600 [Rhododendron molle]|uniref:Uncharacterized protein n=1 Tax=Rhododendron molle TaxID=49168 RepID=A0ACC0Q7Z8_RHOML|nr:hypothetical protein RHMOL_Rhmol01G0331600 [Rhododendron molle]
MEIVMPSFPFDHESPGKEFDWLLSVFAGILMCRTDIIVRKCFGGFANSNASGFCLFRGFSTFHALVVAVASFYLLLFSDLFDEGSRAELIVNRRCTLSDTTLGISLGYFLSDLAMIIWQFPALGGLEFVLHHGLSMVSIFVSLVSGHVQFYTLMVLFTESTTPFINLRWYLDVAGQKSSKLYTLNGVAVFLMWLVMSNELQTLGSLCLYLLNVEHCHMLMETEPAYTITHPLEAWLSLACSNSRGCEDPSVHLLLLPHVYPSLSGKGSVSLRLLRLACSASHAGSDESVLVLENHRRFGENCLEGETPRVRINSCPVL